MKNKLITIFLVLIFNLSSSNFSISEEFKFEATELQVTESGNVIKGIDRGIITTKNNEIVITADTFIYNKFTTLLEAEGNVKIVDKIKDIIIESNKTFYLKNKEEIYTIGKSKAIRGTNIQIDANQYFKYNKFTSLLEAKGDVVLDDRIEDITIYTDEIFYLQNEEKITTLGETNIDVENKYKIKGRDLTLLRNKMVLLSNEKATITDYNSNIYKLSEFEYSIKEEILKGKNINLLRKEKANKEENFFFQTGFFNLKEDKFLGKDVSVIFDKKLFANEKNDPRINSTSGNGDEYNTYLDKGVFTSCKKTDKCPPWKMSANKIHHDKIKKQITYKNAWLELYDFPVVYFPKFFHPDPSVKRQSGLLRPEIGDHSTLGDSIYLPYFFVISDEKDVTLKPRLFNNGTFVMQSEYRQLTKNSLTIVDSSITTNHDSSKLDRGDSRSHFFVNSKIDLDFKKFLKSNLEINYEKISNDNYLKLFDFIKSPLLIEDNSVLESVIKLDLEHDEFDLTTSFEMYETLSGSNTDRYQYVLPTYNFSKNFNLNHINGSFNFNSSGNNTLKNTNVSTSRLINAINFTSIDTYFDNGIIKNFKILVKNINSIGKNSTIYKNSPQSELISTYNYALSMPLMKEYKNRRNTLTPKVSFKISPHDMKNHTNADRRIDVDNIFSSNRLGLEDSFETGESLTLGVNFVKEKLNKIDNEITEIENYFDFKLATVFRFKEEDELPISSTLNKKTSNIFGQLNFKPNEIISLNYNFSLNNDMNTFEYNSIVSNFDFGNFSTKFNYLEERGVIGNSNLIENTTVYNFNEYNSFSFGTRRNRELNLTEYYNLVYEYKNDCLVADIKYRKDYYSDADIIPKEELFFSITIVPFYTYSPNKMILNKDRID
jgi:LPS-assembly protein